MVTVPAGKLQRSVTCAACALLLVLSANGCETNQPQRTALKQLYTPSPKHPPPHEPALVSLRKLPAVYAYFNAHQRSGDRSRFLPTQLGVLAISLATMLLAGFDFRRLRNPRNVDLI